MNSGISCALLQPHGTPGGGTSKSYGAHRSVRTLNEIYMKSFISIKHDLCQKHLPENLVLDQTWLMHKTTTTQWRTPQTSYYSRIFMSTPLHWVRLKSETKDALYRKHRKEMEKKKTKEIQGLPEGLCVFAQLHIYMIQESKISTESTAGPGICPRAPSGSLWHPEFRVPAGRPPASCALCCKSSGCV